jgi:predicted Zn-dependent protease
MMRRVALSLAAGAALGCGEINAPIRPAPYEWRFFVADGGGGVQTLAFAWPASRQPVRIFVEDSLDYPARMDRAIRQWSSQFLYGEFRAVLVSDSNTADVIVRAEPAPASGPIVPLRLHRRARECEGATDLALDVDTKQIVLPMRIYTRPVVEGSAALETCLDLTLAHELGHALGIFEHSLDADDLMANDPSATEPSLRDRVTAERAYHTPTTLTVVGR